MLNYYDLGITFLNMSYSSVENSPENFIKSETTEQPDCRKPCVLIFATDEDNSFLYETLLKLWNYDTVIATSAEKIISLIKTHRPDIVLMDTQINLSDSLLVMKKLKKETALCDIPFILLSGHAQTAVRQSAIAAGAADFCVKPVDFNLLKTIIKKTV